MKINARYAQRFLLALLLALCGVDTALAQAMYRIKPLGYLGGCTTLAPYGYDFNNADEVAGEACNANGDTHAFLWKNDGNPMIDLGPSEVGSRSGGVALSDSGLVGGWASDSTGNFAFTSLGDGTPAKRIYDGLGGTYIGANAINNLGQVTGTASTTNDNEIHAFAWKNDGSPMIDLGTLYSNFDYSEGNAINASGEVAGYILWQGAESHAFIWRNDGTPMLDLVG